MSRKNKFFLVFILGVLLIEMFFPTINVTVGSEKVMILGMVSVPIGRLLMGLVMVFVGRKVWNVDFGLKRKNIRGGSRIGFVILFPLLLILFYNVYFSNSLEILFKELPSGQLMVAMVTSIIGALIVGFFEELVFRGGIFLFLTSAFEKNKRMILVAAIISSIFFGSIHLVNLLTGETFYYVMYQLIYATAIGFTFCMIYVKKQSLWWPIAMHAFVDFGDFFFNIAGEPDLQGYLWVPITLSIAFIVPGILIYRSLEEKPYFKLGFKN
jgi:membrane protease YdiL (CAAX protease family)